jgi:hypothetical protein
MANLFGIYPFLLKLCAYAGNRGPKFRKGLAQVMRTVNVEIFRRCDTGDFVVLLSRRIVPRYAVILALNLAYNADTVGAVTRQLAGANYGMMYIPAPLLDKLA